MVLCQSVPAVEISLRSERDQADLEPDLMRGVRMCKRTDKREETTNVECLRTAPQFLNLAWQAS